MSELNNSLADAFYLVAEEEGNTESLEVIRNNALALVAKGELRTLTSTSINGKSWGWAVSAPATDVLAAVSRAIRKFNRGIVTSTSMDFSQI